MKCVMKNLFHKPKVFFMLMVICLFPLQDIQACPPDCSDAEAAVADAEDVVETAQKELDEAEQNLEKALENYAEAEKPYEDAKKELARAEQVLAAHIAIALGAGLALEAAITARNPIAIAAASLALIGALILVHVAEDDYNEATDVCSEAARALGLADDAVNTCKAAVANAQEVFDAADDALADAEAALEECLSG